MARNSNSNSNSNSTKQRRLRYWATSAQVPVGVLFTGADLGDGTVNFIRAEGDQVWVILPYNVLKRTFAELDVRWGEAGYREVREE